VQQLFWFIHLPPHAIPPPMLCNRRARKGKKIICPPVAPSMHATSARRRHRHKTEKGRNYQDKGITLRKEGMYCLLSYSRYTSLEKVIFCAAESGDDDAFTSLIPGNLSLHTRTAATSSASSPLSAILGCLERTRAERRTRASTRSAPPEPESWPPSPYSASPSPSLPCSHSPPPLNLTTRCVAHDPTTRTFDAPFKPLRYAD